MILRQFDNSLPFLRTWMSFAVVVIHSWNYNHGEVINCYSGISDVIQILFSQGICRVAVPVFFFISGYLFYNGLKDWDWLQYFSKIRRRIHSLLVPYCLWNVFGWLLFCLKNFFVDGKKNIWTKYTPLEVLWSNSEGCPFVIPLWFIRDLMIVVLLSFLIYLLVKRMRLWGLVLIGLLYVSNIWIPFSGFSSVSTFFFAAGCYCQIFEKDPFNISKLVAWVSAVIFVLMLFLIVLCWNRIPINGHLHATLTIFGTILVFKLASLITVDKYSRIYNSLASASFFVFAVHEPYILYLSRVIVNKILPFNNQGIFVIRYFLYAVLTYLICVCIYKLINKLSPKVSKVLVGRGNNDNKI